MAAALSELRDPVALGLAIVTGAVNLAIGVQPALAVLAALVVLLVRVAAGLLWPATPPQPASSLGPLAKLSKRQLEVAVLIAKGLPDKEIARRLFLEEKTVENHGQAIRNKLNLDNRAQIAALVARYIPGAISGSR